MVVAVGAIIFSGYQLFKIKKEENESKTVNKEVIEIIGSESEKKDKKESIIDNNEVDFLTKEAYSKLKDINSDFVGYLYYPSLEINEQVVQTTNNSYYLNHDFYKDYSVYGTVFVEESQNLIEQNTTLYGHWVSNSSLKFSNLHKLKKQEDYDKYKTFYYADEEFIYEYEVGIVIYHHTVEDFDSIPYWQGSFNEEQLKSFIDNAKSQAFYDTGVEFNGDDKIMTLQTCITYDSDERLVIVGKEVKRQAIDWQKP